jgi:hypothetical protein
MQLKELAMNEEEEEGLVFFLFFSFFIRRYLVPTFQPFLWLDIYIQKAKLRI